MFIVYLFNLNAEQIKTTPKSQNILDNHTESSQQNFHFFKTEDYENHFLSDSL